MIADLTSEDAIVVIEFLTVVIEIFYLGPRPKAYGVLRRDNNPPPVYGYQKIDWPLNSYASAVYRAYGPMRARLDPLDPCNTDGGLHRYQEGNHGHCRVG